MEELIYTGSGERIDTWLTTQFPYSRNFFQHLLASERVQLKTAQRNRTSPKKSTKLQSGDVVRIDDLTRFLDGGILEECPRLEIVHWENQLPKTLPDSNNYLGIIKEAHDYLIIYKPKGVLSHPGSIRDVHHPSVVGGLYHYFQAQGLPSMGSFVRAGLVHRLDKETDGLMIIAKTEAGLAHFKQLFQQKSHASSSAQKELVPLKKYYRAIVCPTPAGEEYLKNISSHLPWIIDELVIAKLPHAKEPKQGITKILAITQACSSKERQIDVEILTGRTHQIRYHLSTHGLPIVGDYLYGTENDLPLQLTAIKLEFEDLQGNHHSFDLTRTI